MVAIVDWNGVVPLSHAFKGGVSFPIVDFGVAMDPMELLLPVLFARWIFLIVLFWNFLCEALLEHSAPLCHYVPWLMKHLRLIIIIIIIFFPFEIL